ncbi:MAG: hypothetical protein JWO25_201 [Alphaproteobacteria bacterium]|nr:hypothetical protein [Alphaproteobacteria bacterium]
MRGRIGMLGLAMVAGLIATVGAAQKAAPGRSVPDISAQYRERRNCHGAYDVLVAKRQGGGAVPVSDRLWGKAYEDAGAAGKPCPRPPDSLAGQATNHIVETREGLSRLAYYVDRKDSTAMYEAALSVLTGKASGVEPNIGGSLLRQASDLGEPDAQFFLAMLYVAGKMTGKADYASALPLIERSAASGQPDALFQAGNFYKEGIATRADKKKAFAYYRAAAEQGHLYGAVMAYYMIQDGEGVPKDFDLAYRLARNLADRGEIYGAVMTASALLQRKDAKTHQDEVLYWMDLAIRDGDEHIRSEVAKMRPGVLAAFSRANAPPEFHPRVRKLCPLKTTCFVDHYSGLQSCTANVDYWNDCDS